MKNLNIPLSNREFQTIRKLKVKGGFTSWRMFILSLVSEINAQEIVDGS
jgi:hypothetical protein